MSAGQALKHAYFKDLREQDKSEVIGGTSGAGPSSHNQSTMSAIMRLTQRAGGMDNISHNSKR